MNFSIVGRLLGTIYLWIFAKCLLNSSEDVNTDDIVQKCYKFVFKKSKFEKLL